MRIGLLVIFFIGFGCAGSQASQTRDVAEYHGDTCPSCPVFPEKERAIQKRCPSASVGWGDSRRGLEWSRYSRADAQPLGVYDPSHSGCLRRLHQNGHQRDQWRFRKSISPSIAARPVTVMWCMGYVRSWSAVVHVTKPMTQRPIS